MTDTNLEDVIQVSEADAKRILAAYSNIADELLLLGEERERARQAEEQACARLRRAREAYASKVQHMAEQYAVPPGTYIFSPQLEAFIKPGAVAPLAKGDDT